MIKERVNVSTELFRAIDKFGPKHPKVEELKAIVRAMIEKEKYKGYIH